MAGKSSAGTVSVSSSIANGLSCRRDKDTIKPSAMQISFAFCRGGVSKTSAKDTTKPSAMQISFAFAEAEYLRRSQR